jgi:hypothetical protein
MIEDEFMHLPDRVLYRTRIECAYCLSNMINMIQKEDLLEQIIIDQSYRNFVIYSAHVM